MRIGYLMELFRHLPLQAMAGAHSTARGEQPGYPAIRTQEAPTPRKSDRAECFCRQHEGSLRRKRPLDRLPCRAQRNLLLHGIV